ncbi:MAG TPA: hypothetical protein VM243_10450 [Phycisphaerae bacterium]|nr:hypothetical protein [Phycisphaerae bacterium]
MRYTNTAPVIDHHVRTTSDGVPVMALKAIIFYPARDYLTLDWLWRALFGDEAWNAPVDGLPDGCFVTNRPPSDLTPTAVARGPCTMPPPRPPILVKRVKARGRTPGFIGTDAAGRTFLFKLDHPDFPELGSSAAVIGSRLLWALGYNVPPVFVVRIEGTADERFDGRRATASLFLDHARGHFRFDWFRYRREVRALRIASAWINDTDRIGTNTLVTEDDGPARYFLIDFNSCLGSWNGRPKAPWRGHRHEWDLAEFLIGLLTAGLVHAPCDPDQPVVSPAVGRFDARFDPLRWRSQLPNTAFDRMTDRDMRWIAGKIAGLRREHLAAIVAQAGLSDPADAKYLVEMLMRRRAAILQAAGIADPPARP